MHPHPPLGPESAPDRYRPVRLLSTPDESPLLLAEQQVADAVEAVLIRVVPAADAAPAGAPADQVRGASSGVAGFLERFTAEVAPPGAAPQRALVLVAEYPGGVGLRAWRAELMRGPVQDMRTALDPMRGVAAALDALHSGQAHPDGRTVVVGSLSPGTVMALPQSDGVPVDFGLGPRQDPALPPGRWLTSGYVAPEVAEHGYSAGSDRYAFGATCFFALTGQEPPPDAAGLRERFAALPPVDGAAPERHARLLAMFGDDPAARPPAAQWLRDLTGSASPAPPAAPAPAAAVPAAPAASPAGAPPAAPKGFRRRRTTLLVTLAVATVLILLGASVVTYRMLASGSGASAATPPASDRSSGRETPTARPASEDGSVRDDGSIATGDLGADLPVVEVYTDYQCAKCRTFMKSNGDALAGLAADGDAVVHYRPVSVFAQRLDPLAANSLRAGAAARAAADHGRFVEYSEVLFANQPAEGEEGFTTADLKKWGAEAGIDDPAFADRVESEGKAAEKYVSYVEELVEKGGVHFGAERLQTMPFEELAAWGADNGVDDGFLDDTYVAQVLDATTAVNKRYAPGDGRDAFSGAPSVYINGRLQDADRPAALRKAVGAAGAGTLAD
ncbi:thioredoxin domain-containing protein [Murinocardiopsis flavida]|uniref:thioredoxin domain-containing protein n=1 Tax=Murinocardiopsis flavida TaxID=645275 RepID=UPI0011B1FCF4|nr:thioredoxin domain-containing protein [Murinocardiopsis flavida]